MITFNGNSKPSVGIELELQILDKTTNRLVSYADQIVSAIENPQIKRELFQSTLEIVSSPSTDLNEIEDELKQLLKKAIKAGDKFGVDLVMAGTNPLTSWEEQKVTAIPRYLKMIEKIKWPARIMMIFGLHVHVGVESANAAIYVCNNILAYLPQLLALSASSPFWGKTDTGLASCRTMIFESLPTAGLPDRFKDWHDYEHFVSSMITAGSIDSYRDIWWDVRPHPDFGTVEIRIFDAVPGLKESMSLAALTQMLVHHLAQQYHASITDNHEAPYWLIKENKWRASRYGIDADILVNGGQSTAPISSQIEEMLKTVTPSAKFLGTTGYIDSIREIIKKGPSYKRQLALYNGKRRDFNDILGSLKSELKNSL